MCSSDLETGISVTPLAGVWIEILVLTTMAHIVMVTPLAGVWIEIQYY